MKKFYPLALLLALISFYSCSNDEPTFPDPNPANPTIKISNLVIPEIEDEIQGTSVTISGSGFQQGDTLIMKSLTGGEDFEISNTTISASGLTFTYPENAIELKYDLYLRRKNVKSDFNLGLMQQSTFIPKAWVEDDILRGILKGLKSSLFNSKDSLIISEAADYEFTKNTLGQFTFDITNKEIKSLKGLQYFSKLEELLAYGNSLGDVDLTGLNHLITFHAWSSNITSLKLESNYLRNLYIGSNPLTELDLSKCPGVYYLVIDNIPFTYLNLTNCMDFAQDYSNYKYTFDTSKDCQLIISNIWYWHIDNLRDNPSTSPIVTAMANGVKVTTIGVDGEVVFDNLNDVIDIKNEGKLADMPDATLRGIIKALSPESFSGDKIIISKARAATNVPNTLDISNKGITSLDGLAYFENVWYVVADGNNLGEVNLKAWFNLTTFSAKNAGITSFVAVDQPYLRLLDISDNNKLTKADVRGISRVSDYNNQFIANNCPLESVDIRAAYAWSTWGRNNDYLSFRFTTDKTKTRVLKVETAEGGGWSSTTFTGTNPVTQAISDGVRVEYYDWMNGDTRHYGALISTVN